MIMKQTLTVTLAALLLTGCSSVNSTAKPYPLNDCIVSENELGSMGKPLAIVHEGQTIKFCCKPCIKKFNRQPEKYLVRLTENPAN